MFRYLRMLPKVSRPLITPSSSTIRLFSSRMMSADSLAMSAPLSTEMPTSASRSAGASLMPSPRKPTVWPLACSVLSTRDFCSGVSLANTVVRSTASASAASSSASICAPSSGTPVASPTWRQTFSVTVGLSPVSTFTATPFSRSAASAGAAVSFGGSRKVRKPRTTRSCSSLPRYCSRASAAAIAAGGEQQHAEAVLVVGIGLRDQALAGGGVERLRQAMLVLEACRHRQHLLDRALADQQVRAMRVAHHHRQPAAHEVEGQLVDLAIAEGLGAIAERIGARHDREVHQVLHAALVEAVQPGQVQHLVVALAVHVDVVLEDDAVLGQGAGLVGAEHVHRAEVLDRVQALDHHLAARHRDRALRQVGADDHRQHFRRQAHRHRQREQRRPRASRPWSSR